jgi:hypothetical protein
MCESNNSLLNVKYISKESEDSWVIRNHTLLTWVFFTELQNAPYVSPVPSPVCSKIRMGLKYGALYILFQAEV